MTSSSGAPGRLVLSTAVLLWALAGCEPTLVGSEALVTVTPPLEGQGAETWSRLQLSQELHARAVRGGAPRLQITINENLAKHLIVRTSGKLLALGLDEGFQYERLTAKATVTMPALEHVDLSGASRADLIGFEQTPTPRFEARLSGASALSGPLAAAAVDLDLSGASEARLSGSTGPLDLDLSGASRAGLEGLAAHSARVDLSGGSRAQLLVRDEVHGEASGASSLEVGGGAIVRVETSGASSVTRR
jgi:hypothetical protein